MERYKKKLKFMGIKEGDEDFKELNDAFKVLEEHKKKNLNKKNDN